MSIEIFFWILVAARISCFRVDMSDDEFHKLLKSGSFQGFHTPSEFWRHIQSLQLDPRNANFISDLRPIGRSFQNRPINSFFISDDVSNIDVLLTRKNIVYLNAMHHSREPLSLTMILLIVREVLLSLRSEKHTKFKEFFRDNLIAFVPIVNIDSYTFITNNFSTTSDKEGLMMIRKNRHLSPQCTPFTGGVDLNRNYDFKFGMNESGSSSDPCAEDYRGEFPFSEPETAAIKQFLDDHPNVISGVNIHTYGNAWIYPYNFVSDKANHYLKVRKPLFYDFFKEFEHEMSEKNYKALFGNSAFTLDYPTNGESGDWMIDRKNILNLDVELGNNDKKSDQFYPPAEIHDKIVVFNWAIMREFFFKHIVTLELRQVTRNDGKSHFSFEIFNKAISNLINFSGKLKANFRPSMTGNVPVFVYTYCIKDALTDKCEHIPVVQGEINTTLKGRHVLELNVKSLNRFDIELLDSVELRVTRNVPYKNYEDQIFEFSVRNAV